MSCKTCDALSKQVEYLQQLVDKLLIKSEITPILPPTLKEQAMKQIDDDAEDNHVTMSEGM
jgi:hypothetical protein